MNITFTLTKKESAYKEIASYIQKLIENKTLKKDEKLPSKRALAQSLNVSVNTIMNAYLVLLDAEYIYSIEKKGYFVSDVFKSTIKLNDEIKESKSLIKYDFTTKNIDSTLFPKSIFKRLYTEAINNDTFLNKSPNKGIYNLQLAISKHINQNRGISVLPQQIIIGSGIESLLSLLLPLLNINIFGIENPGYHKVSDIIKNNNKTVKYLDVDKEGVIPNNDVDLIYTTPFNQFPLGIKMSIKRKKELLEFLNNKNKFIIEDDFDAEFRFNTTPSQSLFSLNQQQVIFLSSFSRTISSSLRISYMILPLNLLKKFEEKYYNYSNPVPSIEQYVLADFINNGHYQTHINKLKRIYKQRRKIIEEYFANKDNISIISKDNYLYLLAECKTNFNKPNTIDIDTLAKYDIYKQNSNILLIGYSNINNKELLIALDELYSYVK